MEAKRRRFDPHITWAADYCKHCFTCINICPVKNLKFKDDEMTSLHKCIQCQLCEKYCPDFALEVEPKQAEAKKAGAARAKKGAGKPRPLAKNSGKASPSSRTDSKTRQVPLIKTPRKTKTKTKNTRPGAKA
jgi:2-oxoglutarate ferredoxin oxidoreductase subunit delta